MLRVIAESDPRHDTVIPDGIYGPETVSAVSTFQRLHGLPVTGVTGNATWDAVVDIYNSALVRQARAWPLEIVMDPGQVIRRGERHPNLYIAQAVLAVLSEGYQSIPRPDFTGILDNATEYSLSAFQELSGLPVTGDLDKLTWKHLALQYPLASSLADR